ncbi:MAG: sulfotransferase domain-containing protein [Chloroflexi bacterium]|nr:sulfotransferase domain-containing protein [Chloroflexota bacterium]
MPTTHQPPLVYFGHHKCATQYIKAVVKDTADWLGLDFETVDRPVDPAPVAIDGTVTRHRLHIKGRGYVEPTADVLYFANANAAAIAALNERYGYRGFHVIRDPRDIVVSGYFSHLHSHPITQYNQERMTEWRRQLAAAPSIEAGLLLELEFEDANFANMAGWRYDDTDIYETRYEMLITDPMTIFCQVFRFLGLTTPRLGLSTLVAMLSERALYRLRNQRTTHPTCLPQLILRRILAQNAFERKTGGRLQGQENVRHHYRKGIAGDWRNYFTPRVTAAFKERYGPLLIRLGYEQSLDW